jgi:exodeoxyribonuclease VII large subunit
VRKALIELDRDNSVDVIVITRGGGSFEDLLAFSDEALLRAVAAAATPVVSAIGHEEDSPLLDLVADVRASTPTDAARRIVPDVRDERVRIGDQRDRMRARVVARLSECARDVATLRTHPALRDPRALLNERARLIDDARRTLRHQVGSRLTHEQALALGRRRHLMALSPQATLDRGFAVVRLRESGRVVTSSELLAPHDVVDVRVAAGSFLAHVTTVEPPPPTPTESEVIDD